MSLHKLYIKLKKNRQGRAPIILYIDVTRSKTYNWLARYLRDPLYIFIRGSIYIYSQRKHSNKQRSIITQQRDV